MNVDVLKPSIELLTQEYLLVSGMEKDRIFYSSPPCGIRSDQDNRLEFDQN